MDYLGAQAYFNDRYQMGSLTFAENEVFQSELTAIYQCTSPQDALNILNTVDSEIMQSQMSEQEKSKILIANSLMRQGILNNNYTSKNNTDSNTIYKQSSLAAGIAIGGVVLFCVGVAIMLTGANNNNTSQGAGGFMLGLFGVALGVIAASLEP